jgi:opacity protein-like surface antigen
MKTTRRRTVLALSAIVLSGVWAPAYGESRGIAGIEAGASVPREAFDDAVNVGGYLYSFLGFMFNDYLGAVVELQSVTHDNKDRPGVEDSDLTGIIGGAAGPRVAIPFGRFELYGVGLGGIYTGLASDSAVTDTSGGISAGGGINFRLTDAFAIGASARYNRLYQRVHGQGDVEYITTGLSFTAYFPLVRLVWWP